MIECDRGVPEPYLRIWAVLEHKISPGFRNCRSPLNRAEKKMHARYAGLNEREGKASDYREPIVLSNHLNKFVTIN